jgi:hypothetical protein
MEEEFVRYAGTSLRYTAREITSQSSATSIGAEVVSIKTGTVDEEEDGRRLPPGSSAEVRST